MKQSSAITAFAAALSGVALLYLVTTPAGKEHSGIFHSTLTTFRANEMSKMDGLACDEQRSDDADGHFFINKQTIWPSSMSSVGDQLVAQ